ncbi:MAG: hypothetical protein LBJ14_07325 [Desulfarculales bacterium]|nr:hypothetical protein [Desulfarculales bacterium]
MSITYKYEPLLKGLPGLETAHESPAPAESLLPLPGRDHVPTPAYLPPFPLWFRRNQQRRILIQVENRLTELAFQYQNLNIPARAVIWSLPGLFAAAQSSAAAGESWENSYRLSLVWPVSASSVTSAAVPPNAPAEPAPGNYIMKLKAGGREYEITATVSGAYGKYDSNMSLFKQIAAAVNRRQSEVQASVREDPDFRGADFPYRLPERKVSLEIMPTRPGTDFSLSDEQGDLAARYGLDQRILGSTVRYQIRGQMLVSSEGKASLEEMVGISAPDGSDLALVSGPAPLLQGISLFLSTYNDLLSYLDLHSEYLRPRLKDRLISPQRERADLLSGLGLQVNAQGHIKPSDGFVSRLLKDFPSVHEYMLAGEKAWAPAFIAQNFSVRQMGLAGYAADLLPSRPEQVRSRAWAELEDLRDNIINAYY